MDEHANEKCGISGRRVERSVMDTHGRLAMLVWSQACLEREVFFWFAWQHPYEKKFMIQTHLSVR